MIRLILLLLASFVGGLFWNVGSELGLIFNVVLRPVGLAIIVTVLWPQSQLKPKIALVVVAVVVSNVIVNLTYALQGGLSSVTSDAETQLWMVMSFIIETGISMIVLIVEDRVIAQRILNKPPDVMSHELSPAKSDEVLTQPAFVPEDKTAGGVAPAPTLGKRLESAFGPVLAGMLIDGIDFFSIGPFGHILGFFLAGAAAYWMCSYSGLPRKQSISWSLLAAVYCLIPFVQRIPLATLVGAYLRFRNPQVIPVPAPEAQPVSEQKTEATGGEKPEKGK